MVTEFITLTPSSYLDYAMKIICRRENFNIIIITTKIFLGFLLKKFKNKNKKTQEKSKNIVNNTYIINVINNYADKIEISNLNKNIKTNQEESTDTTFMSLLSY